MYSYIILSTKVKTKGEAMETKDEVIKKLEKRIEGQKDAMIDNISYLQQALNEMDRSINMICYLSYLKEDLTKKDGV